MMGVVLTRHTSGRRVNTSAVAVLRHALVAQLAERFPCKKDVGGSTPSWGSMIHEATCTFNPKIHLLLCGAKILAVDGRLTCTCSREHLDAETKRRRAARAAQSTSP